MDQVPSMYRRFAVVRMLQRRRGRWLIKLSAAAFLFQLHEENARSTLPEEESLRVGDLAELLSALWGDDRLGALAREWSVGSNHGALKHAIGALTADAVLARMRSYYASTTEKLLGTMSLSAAKPAAATSAPVAPPAVAVDPQTLAAAYDAVVRAVRIAAVSDARDGGAVTVAELLTGTHSDMLVKAALPLLAFAARWRLQGPESVAGSNEDALAALLAELDVFHRLSFHRFGGLCAAYCQRDNDVFVAALSEMQRLWLDFVGDANDGDDAPSLALYDFVEDYTAWAREVRTNRGCRVCQPFRPFLLLASGCFVRHAAALVAAASAAAVDAAALPDVSSTVCAARMVSSRLNNPNAAFIPVRRRFVAQVDDGCVRVLHHHRRGCASNAFLDHHPPLFIVTPALGDDEAAADGFLLPAPQLYDCTRPVLSAATGCANPVATALVANVVVGQRAAAAAAFIGDAVRRDSYIVLPAAPPQPPPPLFPLLALRAAVDAFAAAPHQPVNEGRASEDGTDIWPTTTLVIPKEFKSGVPFANRAAALTELRKHIASLPDVFLVDERPGGSEWLLGWCPPPEEVLEAHLLGPLWLTIVAAVVRELEANPPRATTVVVRDASTFPALGAPGLSRRLMGSARAARSSNDVDALKDILARLATADARACVRRRLLDAVDPRRYEVLEFLGDACVDFCVLEHFLRSNLLADVPNLVANVADDEASRIVAAYVTEHTNNERLAQRLPGPLAAMLRIRNGVSTMKKQADVCEALAGALFAALWLDVGGVTQAAALRAVDVLLEAWGILGADEVV